MTNLNFAIRVYCKEHNSRDVITQVVDFPDTLTEEQLIANAKEQVEYIIKNLLKVKNEKI